MKLKLVIPAYQEAKRLPQFLEELCAQLVLLDAEVTVQIVDDGSDLEQRDAMRVAVASVRERFKGLQPLLSLPHNQGKGAAIREGWKNSTEFDWLAFADADGATSASEIVRVIRESLSASNFEVIFASRVKMLGRKIERHWYRHVIGRVFATLVSLLLRIEVYDSQCGFKLIAARRYREIEADLQESGFCFDVEMLLHFQNRGVSVVERPVDWRDIAGSKVKILRDSWRMFRSILEIKKRIRKKKASGKIA